MSTDPKLFQFDRVLTHTERPFLPKAAAAPFVKWAGGKRALIPEISKHLPTNISQYHEPFVGGGACFFSLQHLIDNAVLADSNEELVMAYHVVANDTENLIEALNRHQDNHKAEKGYYMKIRNQSPKPLLDTVARFLYLNKTCYNGLYRVNKSGHFNSPEGKYKNPTICDPKNLRDCAKVLRKATIKLGQFDKTISPKKGDFVYCDPPYDGTFTSYQADGFEQVDQQRLKQCIDDWSTMGVSVMASNADTPFIEELYKGYTVHRVTAPRNISCKGNKREKAAELLITNYE